MRNGADALVVAPDRSIERSFSTHPRKRAKLTTEQMAAFERHEAEMTEKLERVLECRAARAALIGRIGSDLSPLRFENEKPRVTHVGVALRERSGWRVHHLMNTHEGPEGHLYDQPLVDFFRDDPFEYRASVLVPSAALQERIAKTLRSARREALHTRHYSRVSYPFSTRYQNSNQWVLEIVAAAQSGESTRTAVQGYLAARRLAPSVLRTVGLFQQTMGRLISQNTRFDDHPLRERLRGRIAFMLGSSLHRYVRRSDDVLAEVEIALGVPFHPGDEGGAHAESSQ